MISSAAFRFEVPNGRCRNRCKNFKSAALGQRNTVACQQGGKGSVGEEGVFLLAQRRQRVELPQFVIDEAWVAHDDAAVRHALEEARKRGCEIGLAAELIGAGEG